MNHRQNRLMKVAVMSVCVLCEQDCSLISPTVTEITGPALGAYFGTQD